MKNFTLSLLLSSSLLAETFTVTTTLDVGDGSLGDIIRFDAAEGDTIVFDPSLSGETIPMNGDQFAINFDLTIDASNLEGGIILDAGTLSRHFEIAANVTFSLRGATLVNGSSNGENFPVNSGGAIRSSNGTIMNLTDCFFSKNSAGSGGVIRSGDNGTINISRCSFASNSASVDSGAIFNNAILSISNTTFFDNDGGPFGGAIENSGTLTVTHCTFVNNTARGSGGAIDNFGAGTASISNSILFGNTANNGPDFFGPINTGSNNIFGIAPSGGFLSGENNRIGVDPLLAPPANFGGLGLSFLPLPGSPVIEGASDSVVDSDQDQTGRPRTVGPLPDIGAIEAVAICTLPLIDQNGDEIDDRIAAAYPQLLQDLPIPVLAALDTDGDGFTDMEEVKNSTNPNDSNSHLKIVSFTKAEDFTPSNPSFEVTFTSFPGLNYLPSFSENLRTFQPRDTFPFTMFTADDFITSVKVTLSPNRGFFRILPAPPFGPPLP